MCEYALLIGKHDDYPYRLGLNTLKYVNITYTARIDYTYTPRLCGNGFYFRTLDCIYDCFDNCYDGDRLCCISIPKDAQLLRSEDLYIKTQYMSDKIYITKILPLWSIYTIASIGIDRNQMLVHVSRSYRNYLHIIQYLILDGADVHIKHDTPLRQAITNGFIDVVKYLVSAGADIHVMDDQPITLAVEYGHLEVVKYLVSIGANIRVDDEYMIKAASRHGYFDILQYLMSLYVNNTPLYKDACNMSFRTASQYGQLEIVKYQLSMGADVHAEHDFAIRYASTNGHLDVVKYLALLEYM